MAQPPLSELDQLEDLLVAKIPPAIKAARINEAVFCMRIWYYGTSSPDDAVPSLMLIKESTRKDIRAKYGERTSDYIWCADEMTNPGQAFDVRLQDVQLRKLYAKWYQYLCEVDDDQELQLFREMVQRVARKLNSIAWKDFAIVSDDFVVFPADGSHAFCDDRGDLIASALPEQLERLRGRNLLK